jgi:hypothetical protein
MAKLVVRVAYRDELVEVKRVSVDDEDALQRLFGAVEDDMAIRDLGLVLTEGEVWIDLYSDAGQWMYESARFHPADATEALHRYLGLSTTEAKRCLARAHVLKCRAARRTSKPVLDEEG